MKSVLTKSNKKVVDVKVSEIAMAELIADAKRWKEIKAEQERLNAEKEQLKSKFIEYMKYKNIDVLGVEEYKAIISTYEKSTFDQKAFKEAHPKYFKQFLKTETQTRFEIK